MARLTFANFWMGGRWHSDVTMDINEAGELVPALSRLSPTLIEAQNPPDQDGEHPC